MSSSQQFWLMIQQQQLFSCISMQMLFTVYEPTFEYLRGCVKICIYVCVLSGKVSECVRISGEGREQLENEGEREVLDQ